MADSDALHKVREAVQGYRSLGLAAGLSNAQIATDRSLYGGTVRNYISEAISKLGANNRIDAARIARDKGWL